MKASGESSFKNKLTNLLNNTLTNSIYFFEEIGSTQEFANSLSIEESIHGTLIIACEQKRAKGRIGRTWISPQGGLWMSIILRPDFDIDNVIFTQFIGSLAVSDAVRETTNITCRLKWPNDVLINGKKVCGILVDVNLEGDIKKIVMGIGLNANMGSAHINNSISSSTKATSIKEEYGREIDLAYIAKLIVEKIEYYYNNFLKVGKNAEILNRWKRESDMFGKRAIIYDGVHKFAGEVVDLCYDGALLMKLDDSSSKKIISYSDVTFH